MNPEGYAEVAAVLRRFSEQLTADMHTFAVTDANSVKSAEQTVRQARSAIAHTSEGGGRAVLASVRDSPESAATRAAMGFPSKIHASGEFVNVAGLAEHASNMDLPYHVNTACGSRAYAILSEFRRIGIPPEELGIAHSIIPDASAAGLEQAYATGNVMHKTLTPTLSFSERLRAGVGRIIAPDTVEFESTRITLEHQGDNDVVAMAASGNDRIWRAQAPGEPAPYGNHTAAMVGEMVIDPSISPNPMALREWVAGQNYPDAIVMTGRASDEAGKPFDFRDDVMSPGQRARFQAVLARHTEGSPNLIATKFLNLQPDDPALAEITAQETRATPIFYHGQYEYSRSLRNMFTRGNDLAVRINTTGDLAAKVMEDLKPVRAYQHWLERTGGIS